MRIRNCAVGLLALLLALPGGGQQPAPGPVRHVLIVSVDGLKPVTYMDPGAHGLEVPTLRRLAAGGVYSPGMRGVFPTVTYPSHTSLVTGVNPGTHGIVSNRPLDPSGAAGGALYFYAEDIRVPTLWDAAREQGLSTALLYWPVTMGAEADALVPEFWRNDPGPEEQKLHRALARPRGLLEEVAARFPGFWERFTPPRLRDQATTDVAVHLIETMKPRLLLVHLFDVDHFQHSDGPLTGRGLEAIEHADRQIARIIEAAQRAGTWQQTALVVVSDHGFVSYTKTLRVGVLLREMGLITLDERERVRDWKVWPDTGSGFAFFYLRDPADEETKKTLVDAFTAMAAQPGSGIRRVLTGEQVTAMGGDPAAALAVEPEDGWSLGWQATGERVLEGNPRGLHGLPPDREEMRASFLLYGPSIGRARWDDMRMIDVAPTVAALLGLRLERAEGRARPVPLVPAK